MRGSRRLRGLLLAVVLAGCGGGTPPRPTRGARSLPPGIADRARRVFDTSTSGLSLVGVADDVAVLWETIEVDIAQVVWRDDLIVVGLEDGAIRERREGVPYPGSRAPDTPPCAATGESRWGAAMPSSSRWLGCYGASFEDDFRFRAGLAVEIPERGARAPSASRLDLLVTAAADSGAAFAVRGPRPSEPDEVDATLVRWRAADGTLDAFSLELDGSPLQFPRVVGRDANTVALLPQGATSGSLWLVSLSDDGAAEQRLWGGPELSETALDARWWMGALLYLHGAHERTCLERYASGRTETVLCVSEMFLAIRAVDASGVLLASAEGEHRRFDWAGREVERLPTARSEFLDVTDDGTLIVVDSAGSTLTFWESESRRVSVPVGPWVLGAQAGDDALFVLRERRQPDGLTVRELIEYPLLRERRP